MTEIQTTCPSNEALITALYGEAAADDLRRIDAHLAVCAACREEWDGLRGVRSVLREWQAPEMPVHIRIVAGDADALPAVPAHAPRSPLSIYATAGLAAAATLVLGLAAGLANLNVRIDGSGITFTTGRGSAPAAAAASPAPLPAEPVPAGTTAPAPWRTELVALEQRLRNELETARTAAPAATAVSTAGPAVESPAVLATVRSMIDEAETRQQRAMAVRFTEFMRDVDAQRRTDLVNIQNGFGQLEGRTTAEAARAQEMMNYIYRVSTQQPPR